MSAENAAMVGGDHSDGVGFTGDLAEHFEPGGVDEPCLHQSSKGPLIGCEFMQDLVFRMAVGKMVDKIVNDREQGGILIGGKLAADILPFGEIQHLDILGR